MVGLFNGSGVGSMLIVDCGLWIVDCGLHKAVELCGRRATNSKGASD